MTDTSQIILRIPGPWVDHSDLIRTIAETNLNEAVAAGSIVMDIVGKRHAELFTFDHDNNLANAFRKGSGNALDQATLDAIDRHTLVPCIALEYVEAGLAERLAFFSGVLRKAGGLAVKVELAGVAHPWKRWDTLIAKGDPYSLYYALVAHVADSDHISSFGMQQFGLPDAEIDGDPRDGDAQWTLAAFNVYQWTERPTFKSGQTFSSAADAQRYQLTRIDDERYDPDDPFYNPNGVWVLETV